MVGNSLLACFQELLHQIAEEAQKNIVVVLLGPQQGDLKLCGTDQISQIYIQSGMDKIKKSCSLKQPGTQLLWRHGS